MTTTPVQVGDFFILGRLAAGGMSELFEAQRVGGPIVCLKRVHPRHLDDEDLVAAFIEEAELAASLEHPNVVEVFEWGEDGGYYIAMERVDGFDLSALLTEQRPLPPDAVAFVGHELARALAYVHHTEARTRGAVIHCDVTPHNVLIDAAGAVKLADFGVAKAIAATNAATFTRLRGKDGYLAPEQLAGEPIDHRADLFGLGVVLWECLLGVHPYREGRPPGRSAKEWTESRVRANARDVVAERAPHAPAALLEVIEGLLQPSDERLAPADLVAERLAGVVGAGREQLRARVAARRASEERA